MISHEERIARSRCTMYVQRGDIYRTMSKLLDCFLNSIQSEI